MSEGGGSLRDRPSLTPSTQLSEPLFISTTGPHLWHCSRTQSSSAFLAETLKRWCSGEPRGGAGLLQAEPLDRVERESRLASDSMED